MATTHPAPGELIDLHPKRSSAAGDAPAAETLVRAEHVEVFRLDMRAGKELPEHAVASVVTIQCLEGKVEVVAHGRTQELRAGTMVYILGGEPHSVKAVDDASILVALLVYRV